ncbi:unnamed protein product [Amoebophrya sp. A25]|nr:unnamed protein product [Amoebophrya sp. A25]|eukprot:GSA25T00017428001.1
MYRLPRPGRDPELYRTTLESLGLVPPADVQRTALDSEIVAPAREGDASGVGNSAAVALGLPLPVLGYHGQNLDGGLPDNETRTQIALQDRNFSAVLAASTSSSTSWVIRDGTWGGIFKMNLYLQQGRTSDRLKGGPRNKICREGRRFWWCLLPLDEPERGASSRIRKTKPCARACRVFRVQRSTCEHQRRIKGKEPRQTELHMAVFFLRARFLLSRWVRGGMQRLSDDDKKSLRDLFTQCLQPALDVHALGADMSDKRAVQKLCTLTDEDLTFLQVGSNFVLDNDGEMAGDAGGDLGDNDSDHVEELSEYPATPPARASRRRGGVCGDVEDAEGGGADSYPGNAAHLEEGEGLSSDEGGGR